MRILLVQLGDIGDLVLTTPAIDALREAHPDAHISLLTTSHSAPVVENLKLLNEIITIDRRAFNSSWALLQPENLRIIVGLGHYDVVVYFHHLTLRLGTLKFALIALATRARRRIGMDNGQGWFLTERLLDEGFGAKHQAQYWLDLVGPLGAETRPRPAIISLADSTLVPPGDSKRVVIHAGSGGYSMARRWDPAAFAQLADALYTQTGAAVLLVGSISDDSATVKAAMDAPVQDFSGQTTLPELASLIAGADLFIGADSGVMHLAAAAGTPVLAIFGPSNPDAWGPWQPGGQTVILRSAPECSPCSYVGHGIGLRAGCAARTCMRMVTPGQVLETAVMMLGGYLTGTSSEASAKAVPQASTQQTDPPAPYKRIRILDLPVDAITYAQWLDQIADWVASEGTHHVCTVNPEMLIIAGHDPNFRHILHRADLCVPDGIGLLWAAHQQGTPLPERVTGSDGLPIIAARAAEAGWRLFFLGAGVGIAEKAAAVLREKHPNLQIVGTYSGSPAPAEEDALVQRVNASGADLLFVAYGAPEQDKWIARNLPRLQVKMAMGVGGALDFVAGVLPRAPLWMQRLGLEWLFRLYLQPWRIGRMLRLPRFVLAVLLNHRRD